jgi:hypothetical protein
MRYMPAQMSLLLMLAAACASSGKSSGTGGPAPAAAADSAGPTSGVQVVIDNSNINDLNIYLLKGGSRVLVGRAPALKKSTLTIPESVTPANAQIKLLAVPPGSSRPIPTPATVVPHGQRLYWSIGSDPSMSTVSTGE